MESGKSQAKSNCLVSVKAYPSLSYNLSVSENCNLALPQTPGKVPAPGSVWLTELVNSLTQPQDL